MSLTDCVGRRAGIVRSDSRWLMESGNVRMITFARRYSVRYLMLPEPEGRPIGGNKSKPFTDPVIAREWRCRLPHLAATGEAEPDDVPQVPAMVRKPSCFLALFTLQVGAG